MHIQIYKFFKFQNNGVNKFAFFLHRKLWLFIQVIAFSNSSWNPFTYCVFSTEFRKGFKKIFCWKKESAAEENREMKNRKNAADSDNTADCKSNAMTVNTDTSSKNTNGHQTASNSAI